MIRSVGALAVTLSISNVAWAQQHPTFQDLWSAATEKHDCAPADYADFILVTCKDELTFWYFTKPNHPAHPGVIKRTMVQENGGWVAKKRGSSFAPDAAQSAFKAWFAQIVELDRQMKESIAKAHEGASE